MTEELQPVEALARAMDPDAFAGDPSPDRDVWYWDARQHLAREHAGRALAAGWTQIPRRAGRTYWDNQPEERVRFALLGALTELMETERILAKALGYPRGDGGPNDPTGGDFITGEHTAVTLAMEAARALRETGDRTATYSNEVAAPGDPLEPRDEPRKS